MSIASRIRARLSEMQVGDVIELPPMQTHADAHYAVQSHCRREIMRELLLFNVRTVDGVVTIERLPFDL